MDLGARSSNSVRPPPPRLPRAPRGAVEVPVGATVKTACSGSVVHVSVCKEHDCAEVLTAPCAPYGCDGAHRWCAVACTSASDCSSASACNPATSQCVFMDNQCTDAYTIQEPNGTQSSCRPYHCLAGHCHQVCTTDGDCADGYRCASASCVAK